MYSKRAAGSVRLSKVKWFHRCEARSTVWLATLFSGCVLVSGIAATPASALPTHVFANSYGSVGSASGEFKGPTATAVNLMTHNVYVTDPGNSRIQEFDSAGNFLLMFGKDVNETTGGDVCTAASGNTCQAGVGGSGGGSQFSTPTFVAIDNSGGSSEGDVYVGDTGNGMVAKFTESGNFISDNDGSSATEGPFGTVAGIAVDVSGHLWVYSTSTEMFEFDQNGNFVQNWESGYGVTQSGIAVDSSDNLYVVRFNPLVEKFNESGTDLGQVSPGEDNLVTGVAIDPSDNDLYVDQSGARVEHFVSSCEPASGPCTAVDTFGAGYMRGAAGMSIDPVGDRIYVADTSDERVDVFDSASARVDGEAALSPTDNSVALKGSINPLETDTSYRFEYGTTSSYGERLPNPDGDLGAGNGDRSVAAQLTGLKPSTVYHYRLVATNSTGTVDGPDRTFETEPAECSNSAYRVGPGEDLPDCRAYEMVTPLDKSDSEDLFGSTTGSAGSSESIRFTTDEGYSSDSGNGFLLNTDAAFGESPAAGHNTYVFSRNTNGWKSTSVFPRINGVRSVEASIFDPEFSHVGVNIYNGGQTSPSREVTNVFGPPGGPYANLVTVPATEDSELVGASTEFDHVVLQTTDHSIVPAANGQVPGSHELYEWFNGQPRLVNVTTGGLPISPCGARLGDSTSAGDTHNAVSTDGSKIFFVSPDPETGTGNPNCFNAGEPSVNPPHLYMRVNGTTTVDVSAPDPGVNDPEGFQPVQYVGASTDGSKVFFMTRTELTADDTTHDPELYEYDTLNSTLTRISRGSSGTADGNVRFVGSISNDGSAVYFTAYGRLALGAPKVPNGGEEINLYHYDTITGTTAFIATISTHDFSDDQVGRYAFEWETGLDVRSNWYSTPDGRYLIFGSVMNLTNYNSDGKNEIYRYDSTDGSLLCVSCLPSGAPPVSEALFARSALYNDNPTGRPPRAASDDGSDVFFDTADALVPQDTNGKIDVYEWHDGAISLISSGTDPYDSFFLDASPDGSNVFFGTHAELTAADTDVVGDLYDARVGGGFASLIASTGCTEEGCQGLPSGSPALSPAASELFVGPGNPVQTSATGGKKKPAKQKPVAKKKKRHVKRKAKKHRGKGHQVKGARR